MSSEVAQNITSATYKGADMFEMSYTHPLDTVRIVLYQRSGHMALKPCYNAHQASFIPKRL